VSKELGQGESQRITFLETKGDQLDNLDTGYKREVLKFLSSNFAWDSTVPAGTLEFDQLFGGARRNNGRSSSSWSSRLSGSISGSGRSSESTNVA
jgi:type III restriction enzyme